MSDQEDIYDMPTAPSTAHSGKVAQLARAFESSLKDPISPYTEGFLPPKKAKPKLVFSPGPGLLPDMGRVKDNLRPISVARHGKPEVTPTSVDGTEPADPGLRSVDVDRTDKLSVRKPSIRESLFPPESSAEINVLSSENTTSFLSTSDGVFRTVSLPPVDGLDPPAKPEIVYVDLNAFKRIPDYGDNDEIYDDIADNRTSQASYSDVPLRHTDVRDGTQSSAMSRISDMSPEDEQREFGAARGTVFETIDDDEAEELYDDVTGQDIYQAIN
ncbi:hypothetical protein LSH36_807g00120 [Paralvinella palmiformis]|uniref:Uncharacterized protein n=1 Tax=Paralvinella palmiformis TaxID=53620 RepID=A0AAD9J076_9ANNE|nr:hypothetical protein LSH36_807g00120 [Paralvinella palmiformis]